MLTQMVSQVELRFWDWAIPTLSHSRRLQSLLRQFRPLANRSSLRKIGLRSLLIAVIGFSGGAFLAVLSR